MEIAWIDDLKDIIRHGGVVEDDCHRQCAHGDRVRFKRGRNAEDTAEEWSHGMLYYVDSEKMWYVQSDDGDWFRLGSGWEEVCAWEYDDERHGQSI